MPWADCSAPSSGLSLGSGGGPGCGPHSFPFPSQGFTPMTVPDLLRGAVFVSEDAAPHTQRCVRPLSEGPRQRDQPVFPEEIAMGLA